MPKPTAPLPSREDPTITCGLALWRLWVTGTIERTDAFMNYGVGVGLVAEVDACWRMYDETGPIKNEADRERFERMAAAFFERPIRHYSNVRLAELVDGELLVRPTRYRSALHAGAVVAVGRFMRPDIAQFVAYDEGEPARTSFVLLESEEWDESGAAERQDAALDALRAYGKAIHAYVEASEGGTVRNGHRKPPEWEELAPLAAIISDHAGRVADHARRLVDGVAHAFWPTKAGTRPAAAPRGDGVNRLFLPLASKAPDAIVAAFFENTSARQEAFRLAATSLRAHEGTLGQEAVEAGERTTGHRSCSGRLLTAVAAHVLARALDGVFPTELLYDAVGYRLGEATVRLAVDNVYAAGSQREPPLHQLTQERELEWLARVVVGAVADAIDHLAAVEDMRAALGG